MTTIYKFRAPDNPGEKVHDIHNARITKILSVGLDLHGLACVWVEVDEGPDFNDVLTVSTVWTGHTPPEGLGYVGTFVDRELILHVYARSNSLNYDVDHEDRVLERVLVDEICSAASSPEEIAKRIIKRLRDMGVIDE